MALLIHFVSSGQMVSERFRAQIDPTKYPVIKFEWSLPGNIQVIMNEGLTNIDVEKYDQAVINFTQVLKEKPDFWPALYYRGVAYRIAGDHEKAKADFIACVLKENALVAGHYLLAETYYQLHALSEAEATYRKVIKMESSHALALYGLANVNLARYDFSDAERYYEKSTAVDPAFAQGYIMQGVLKIRSNGKKNTAALQLLDRGLAIDSLISEGLFWRGMIYLDRRDYVRCLRDWNNLVRAHPNDPYYLIFRSFLHIELKDFDRAFNDIKKAVLMHKLDVNAYKASETALDKQIELQNAAAYVARFSYGLNEHALISFKKGFCYFVAGNSAQSNYFLKLAENTEPSATIFYMRAVNYDHSSKHDSAHIYYDKALALDNEIIDAHKKRAIYRYQLGDWKGAYADLDQMLRLEPSMHVTYRIRGYIRAHQKDYVEAINDLTTFLKVDSVDADAWKTRGYCRGEINDVAGKLADYRQSLRLNPSDEPILNELAEQYAATSDTTNLISFHNEFKDTYSNSPAFKYLLIDYFINAKSWKRASLEVEKNRLLESEEGKDDTNRKRVFSILARYNGLIELGQQHYDQAVKNFTLALTIYEFNHEARFLRGKTYLAMGDRKQAIEDFQFLTGVYYPEAAAMLKEARKRPKK
ncbi:tetratricopeptide repeat protein [Pseudochryseolinea flava]|nr:tetratricopeptide repeat protein [Pseudochryseolinea flava]